MAACTRPASVNGDVTPVEAPHDRSVLFGDELHGGSDQYLYDVVQRLRPEWLRTHGASSIGTGLGGNGDGDPVRVYVGLVRLGGPEVLTRLTTEHVDSLRFFTPGQAQARFGPGHPNGAIQVITAAPPRP
jgi:hypothetical protein